METEQKFSETFQYMLRSLESSLLHIVQSSEITDREKAILVKSVITRPLGVLNKKHNLHSNSGTQQRLELMKLRRQK